MNVLLETGSRSYLIFYDLLDHLFDLLELILT